MTPILYSDVVVLGVDPAPSKKTVIFDGNEFRPVKAKDLYAALRRLADGHRALVAWDAPLSFDPAYGLSDRQVDKEERARVKKAGASFAKGAVSVLTFSACSHWAISCHVLGLPYGLPEDRFHLVDSPTKIDGSRCAIEVHPAVTLGRWWLASAQPGAMPRYKGSASECGKIVDKLSPFLEQIGAGPVPPDARLSDDNLDAWVAWRMGMDFLSGNAVWCGSPKQGGYVLPR